MSLPEPILSLEKISKSFSGVQVLHAISVQVNAGEVMGILGENGAGKSTLLKIISGIYQRSSGQVLVAGEAVEITSPSDAKALGIAMIPQEFNLIASLSVFENIFLGQELKGRLLLNKKAMRQRTHQLLNLLETQLSPDALIEELSVAEKQMVEIAKALVNEARILIMDEPTTVLTSQEVEVLFKLIDKLKAQGVTILFISHKLKEVKQLCDRLIILRDGELISVDQVSEIDEQDMARKMVGRELNQVFPPRSQVQRKVALKVENLAVKNLLSNISFEVRQGEVLGFAGLIGSGRTETAEAIMGLRRRQTGDIYVQQQAVQINNIKDAVKHGLAYLSEDRQGCGLTMNFNLPENISLISLNNYSKGFINHAQTREKAQQYVRKFDIKAASLDTELLYLSGGNQQKVYLSKWMDTQPQVLILDEPTRGVDVNTKKEIYHFVQSMTEQGLAVVVISSDMEELIGLAHRVLVMREGQIQGELHDQDINEQQIMFLAAGLQSQAAPLSATLQENHQ
ncbi:MULTISPECIES: sugar ABC transporter ATP-binding protein [unclassified Agarivorans]|uniref:sugar ABC transporter ATP-binding protein n=1 Tax=unclassified Agarivorans TaxID=2636026 RepID=UPI0026E1F111|nr:MULTISPECIES: sugar ABC transporter ATP-binding protein [unclassified Agarivorans]MDO6687935.1 sugar ABC transporter ATP-binding protein [Agarivorans sp. 3_MG-2023]MDO6717557.1 sugar ABC transporter ATP-binding protein [Agarivorans sp. 2_MG-2023]